MFLPFLSRQRESEEDSIFFSRHSWPVLLVGTGQHSVLVKKAVQAGSGIRSPVGSPWPRGRAAPAVLQLQCRARASLLGVQIGEGGGSRPYIHHPAMRRLPTRGKGRRNPASSSVRPAANVCCCCCPDYYAAHSARRGSAGCGSTAAQSSRFSVYSPSPPSAALRLRLLEKKKKFRPWRCARHRTPSEKTPWFARGNSIDDTRARKLYQTDVFCSTTIPEQSVTCTVPTLGPLYDI